MAFRALMSPLRMSSRAILLAGAVGGGIVLGERHRPDSAPQQRWFQTVGMRMVLAEAAAAASPVPVPVSEDFGPEVLDGMRRIGAGPRLMTPLKVKVYTIALFPRDEERVRRAAEQWRGSNSNELNDDKGFWAEMLKNGGEWTMLMKIVRPVGGKHMQQGFDRGLLKRVRALDKQGLPGGKAALKQFNGVFVSVGTLAADCLVEVTFHGGGRGLQVVIRSPSGGLLGESEIENEALCHAIWEMFLSSGSPASPEAKASISSGLAELLVVHEG